MNLDRLRELDRKDTLAPLRHRFDLPQGKIYLDGNSLGALPHGVTERIERLLNREWHTDLIAGWNTHDWIGLPSRVGERIARLIGASPGQVICTDSISVNLFKLLSTALNLRPGRTTILSQQDNFPTDLYMAKGLSALLGPERCEVKCVSTDQLLESIDNNVSVLMLTQVNFRDGTLHDIQFLTKKAHDRGALVLWDLAHSAGVVPLELDEWNVDMAVGCGYKYLNGGPGAPAFLYLAKRHHEEAAQPLQGWMGHASPFEFSADYEPAGGIQSFMAGTPGILGMAALDAALHVFEDVSLDDLRTKSQALTQTFIELILELDLPGIRVLSPLQPDNRGSQVSLSHQSGFAISQALIEQGIIVDFRAPDIIRFGFSPLYNTFSDAGLAASALAKIIENKLFLESKYLVRNKVT